MDGIPQIKLDAIGFGISDFTVIPTLELSGALYISGLSDPQNAYLASKLGGKFNGTGIKALTAFELLSLKPQGLCLDVSGGPGGIPLGTTGFLLTGVAGGLSFSNSGENPCDFSSYTSYQEVVREAKLDPTTYAVLEEAELRTVEPDPQTPSVPRLAGQPMPSARPCPCTAPGCPGNCPPPSMNLLCQPHPDPQRYPGRAILKFSSLDEDTLKLVRLPQADGSSINLIDYLRQANGTPLETIVDQVITGLEGFLRELLPAVPTPQPVPGLDPTVSEIFQDPLAYLSAQLRTQLDMALHSASGGRSPYQIIIEVLERGVDCPDITLQLTGTFSYTGISAFLSVSGGINLSSTGAAGIIGSVNVLGMPIGQLRAFLNFTDTSGNPDLALCGDLRFTVGPLDLGLLAFSQRCEGCISGQITALTSTLEEALNEGAEAALRTVLNRIDGELLEVSDLPAVLSEIPARPELAMAMLGELLLKPPTEFPQNLTQRLIQRTWDAFNPSFVLCGEIRPQLFGLALGGELVSTKGWIDKTGMGASFAFSPAYLLGRICPIADLLSGMDRAVFGFALSFPDPFDPVDPVDPVDRVARLLEGLTGGYRRPDELKLYLDNGFDQLLQGAVFTISYEISPFGLKLTQSSARVVLPQFSNHPRYRSPADPWRRPEDREPPLPSRMAVLEAALLSNSSNGTALLADTQWKGDLGELDDQFITQWPQISRLSLGTHYFPHGGILGAGRLALPKALTDAPPRELLTAIFAESTNPLVRIQRALSYVTDYLLDTQEVGSLLFYDPAPNPPQDPTQLSHWAVMEAMLGQNFTEQRPQPDQRYAGGEAFLHGFLDGQLLGIPLASAELVGVPPERSGSGEGRFEIRANIPENSWLAKIVGTVELRFLLRQSPPLPIAQYALMLQLLLQAAQNPPRNPNQIQALLHTLEQQLAAEDPLETLLQRGAPQGSDNPVVRGSLSKQANVQRQQLLKKARLFLNRLLSMNLFQCADASMALLLSALSDQLPKISLTVDIAELQVPRELSFLKVGPDTRVQLVAYSPYYGHDSRRSLRNQTDTVRQQGGMALRLSNLGFEIGPFRGNIDQASIALGAPPLGRPALPYLAGDLAVRQVTIPGLTLEAVRLQFSTHPLSVRLVAELDSIDLGVLRIEPLDGRASLRVTVNSSGTLSIDPARVVVPVLGPNSQVRIHDREINDLFSFSPERVWHAGLSISGFALKNPFFPSAAPLFTLNGTVTASLRGQGLNRASLSVNLGNTQTPTTLTLLPGTPLAVGGAVNGSLHITADGAFTYRGEHSLNLPQLSATGTLEVGRRPPGINAYARLLNATVQIANLPQAEASLEIDSSRVAAQLDLGNGFLGIPGLFQMRAGQWALDYPLSGSPLHLSAGNALSGRLLGRELPSLQSLDLMVDRQQGEMTFSATANSWLPLLPNLLELQPQDLHLRLGSSNAGLEISGTIRAFANSNNDWRINRSLDLSLSAGSFEVPLLKGNKLSFLPTSGLVHRRSDSRLVLRRDNNGTLSLALHNVGISFNGTHILSATIAADGTAEFAWDMDIASNGLRYQSDEKIKVRVNLRSFNGLPTLIIPPGRVKADFPGWPSQGYGFPAETVTINDGDPDISRIFNRTARDWQTVPGVPAAEYRLTVPKLTVDLNGTTLSAALSGGIEIRTTATRPDTGKPWASASKTFNKALNVDGKLTLTFPHWPDIGDPLAVLRSQCERPHNPFRSRCNSLFPKPPPVPVLENLSVGLPTLLA